MTVESNIGLLRSLSSDLAGIVKEAAASIVRVDDGTRLTATGLVWSADGLIVTTSHGVERDEEIGVEMADGSRLAAALLGRDTETDVALLRVQTSGLSPVRSATSAETQIGNLVLALARPGQSGLQATLGIISARFDSQNKGKEEYILHTDALLYPGFSGGALVAMDGSAVGMTNLMFGRGKGVALGMPVVTNVVAALLTGGSFQRGYLGISTQQVAIPTTLQQSLSPVQEQGLLILQVEANSGAEQGGLYLGDTILKLNGQPVPDVDALRQHLRGLPVGQTIDLQILRGGELRDTQVTLGHQK